MYSKKQRESLIEKMQATMLLYRVFNDENRCI